MSKFLKKFIIAGTAITAGVAGFLAWKKSKEDTTVTDDDFEDEDCDCDDCKCDESDDEESTEDSSKEDDTQRTYVSIPTPEYDNLESEVMDDVKENENTEDVSVEASEDDVDFLSDEAKDL